MKVLFTNIQLDHRTGTEIVIRDMALAVRRRGHDAAVYTPHPGPLAEELIDQGVPVVDRIEHVPFAPDIVHGHHHEPTVIALTHFANTPAIWVCHDRFQYTDIPPRHPEIRRYVAVDLNCRERLVAEAGVPEAQVRLIHNSVDLGRFHRRTPLPAQITRAAVYSNYAKAGGFMEVVAEACRRLAISLDVIGEQSGASSDSPEHLLGTYDVVFAKARCALEAMAAGCAVVLLDRAGLGPMVSTHDMAELRDWNFGARCLQSRPTPERIATQLQGYNPDDAARVTDWIRGVAHLEASVDEYLSLYDEALHADRSPTPTSDHSALDLALQYAATLEQRLRAAQEPIAIPPLPRLIGSKVRVRVAAGRQRARPGSTFGVDVTVSNDSSEVLASVGLNPVHLSYHWTPAPDDGPNPGEGIRTPLARPVHPGSTWTTRMSVVAPDVPGTYALRVSLLQEGVFWFDELTPPSACWLTVDVNDVVGDCESTPVMSLTGLVAIRGLLPPDDLRILRDGFFTDLGFVDDSGAQILVFAESEAFVRRAIANPAVSCIITTMALGKLASAKCGVLVADDPKLTFFRLHNRLAESTGFFDDPQMSTVASSARVHASASIDPFSVRIAEHCVIGPNVVISGPVTVGARTTIDAGTVIGSAAFQTSARTGSYMELQHVGGVAIGEDCHIYSNATIARGVFRANTEIGDRCQIGNNAFVSHQCRLGDNVFVGHGATVNGRVTIGDSTWIGPGAVISDQLTIGAGAHIALGATVMRDVPDDGRVSGLPAMDQRTMFRHAASVRRRKT